jgi:hypothetical protein
VAVNLPRALLDPVLGVVIVKDHIRRADGRHVVNLSWASIHVVPLYPEAILRHLDPFYLDNVWADPIQHLV